MPTIHKTLLIIEHIRKIRRGLDVGEGAKSTIFETEGGSQRITDLQNYLDDPDDATYFKLKRIKGARILHCLPFKEPKAYKILYTTGRAFSIANNTLNRRTIEAHLSTFFDCRVRVMCRNINWKAGDLTSTPGVFELMAFLDGAPLGGKFDDLNPSELDGKLYSIVDDKFKEHILPRLQDLEDTVEELQGDLEKLQTHVETLDERVEEYVDGKMSGIEARLEDKVDERVEEIGTDLQSIREYVDGKMSEMEARLQDKVDERVEEIGTDLQSIREYVDGKMAEMEARLEDKVTQQVLRMLEEFDRQKLEAAGTNCKVATITRVSMPPREDFP